MVINILLSQQFYSYAILFILISPCQGMKENFQNLKIFQNNLKCILKQKIKTKIKIMIIFKHKNPCNTGDNLNSYENINRTFLTDLLLIEDKFISAQYVK